MLIVVIPVFILTGYIAIKYREGNKSARYSPDFDHSPLVEGLWWAIPFIIIAILSVMAWNSSHSLDPFKPITSDKEPLKIQVVAMQWKWLFIYPEQGIASVNMAHLPVDRPVNFEITSDAPMNSFWIPQLGGQIYAMAGMRTKLHLIADTPGYYHGQSANISGSGFAGMTFTARACQPPDFEKWLAEVKNSSQDLTMANYDQLAEPSKNNPASYYSQADDGLFDAVIAKYMSPGHQMAAQARTH
jgi:cytochrome o ubiquinol oxidase subunit 2